MARLRSPRPATAIGRPSGRNQYAAPEKTDHRNTSSSNEGPRTAKVRNGWRRRTRGIEDASQIIARERVVYRDQVIPLLSKKSMPTEIIRIMPKLTEISSTAIRRISDGVSRSALSEAGSSTPFMVTLRIPAGAAGIRTSPFGRAGTAGEPQSEQKSTSSER